MSFGTGPFHKRGFSRALIPTLGLEMPAERLKGHRGRGFSALLRKQFLL